MAGGNVFMVPPEYYGGVAQGQTLQGVGQLIAQIIGQVQQGRERRRLEEMQENAQAVQLASIMAELYPGTGTATEMLKGRFPEIAVATEGKQEYTSPEINRGRRINSIYAKQSKGEALSDGEQMMLNMFELGTPESYGDINDRLKHDREMRSLQREGAAQGIELNEQQLKEYRQRFKDRTELDAAIAGFASSRPDLFPEGVTPSKNSLDALSLFLNLEDSQLNLDVKNEQILNLRLERQKIRAELERAKAESDPLMEAHVQTLMKATGLHPRTVILGLQGKLPEVQQENFNKELELYRQSLVAEMRGKLQTANVASDALKDLISLSKEAPGLVDAQVLGAAGESALNAILPGAVQFDPDASWWLGDQPRLKLLTPHALLGAAVRDMDTPSASTVGTTSGLDPAAQTAVAPGPTDIDWSDPAAVKSFASEMSQALGGVEAFKQQALVLQNSGDLTPEQYGALITAVEGGEVTAATPAATAEPPRRAPSPTPKITPIDRIEGPTGSIPRSSASTISRRKQNRVRERIERVRRKLDSENRHLTKLEEQLKLPSTIPGYRQGLVDRQRERIAKIQEEITRLEAELGGR